MERVIRRNQMVNNSKKVVVRKRKKKMSLQRRFEKISAVIVGDIIGAFVLYLLLELFFGRIY